MCRDHQHMIREEFNHLRNMLNRSHRSSILSDENASGDQTRFR
jgi:hypothetical protein